MTNQQRILVILAIAVALAAGLWVGQRQFLAPASGPATIPGLPQMQAALLYPTPRPIPAFELVRTDGTPFTNADLAGHWTLAFFGFTHCPDICPDTLARMQDVRERLVARGAADAVVMVFVSVDPERDNGETIQRYIEFFDPSIIGVTGERAQIDVLTRAIGVVYRKVELDGGGYTIDHSSQLVLFDPEGRQAGIFRPPFDPAKLAADLVTLSGGGVWRDSN
jgi:protein SCO1/2